MATGSVTTLGIGSGLDLQNILDQLKATERAPIAAKENEKTTLTNEINAYNSINTKLFSMKSKALSLSLESEFLKNTAGVSDEDILTASANNGIGSSSHTIEVVQKAQYNSWQTNGVESGDTVIYAGPDTGIDSVLAAAATESGTMTIKYGALENQQDIEIGISSGMSLTDIVTAINTMETNKDADGNMMVKASLASTGSGNYYVRVASASGGNTAETQVSVEGSGAGLVAPDVTISIGKADTDPMYLSVAAGTNYEQMAAEINAASDNIGVTANIVDNGSAENPYRLILTSSGTGEKNRLQVQNLPMAEVEGAGEGNLNAVIKVNGVEYQRSSNDGISDIISGVTLNLKKTGETSLGIQTDLDPVKQNIISLVEQYNDLVSEIKGSDEEDSEGEENPLADSFDVKNMISRIKSLITTSINTESEYISLVDLGIELDRDGSMHLDETKLEQAIASNPDAVQSLFLGDEEAGITGLGDIINDGLTAMISSQGMVSNKIDQAEIRMDTLDNDILLAQERLDKRYDILASQFAQLDSYINSLNNQASFMQSMIDSFNNTASNSNR